MPRGNLCQGCLLIAFLLLPPGVSAGHGCEERALAPANLYRASTAAFHLYQALQSAGPEAAIVGRVGSDVSAYGLKYTHAGIVLRDHPKGRWLFVHSLNECGTDRAGLYDEGLMNFFLDSPFSLDALVLIPSPALQQRLARIVLGGTGARLHQPAYSMLAYPRSTRYQNSNGWVLEVIAAAQAGGTPAGREELQSFLALAGFRGSRIHLSPFKQLGASLFAGNVRFDDHPEEAVTAADYEVVTVESLADYLQRTDQAEVLELRFMEE